MRVRVGPGLIFGLCLCAQAQWLHEKTPGAPRLADGSVNPAGPVPRINGHPDLSGVWQAQAEPRGAGLFGLGESPNSKYFRNILSDFKPGEEPLTPWGAELIRKHAQAGPTAGPSFNCLPDGVPHADLLPEPFKIVQLPREIVFLYEVETMFRQIYLDGRKEPEDPRPTWMGYATGKWEGDTLVVNTMGFNELSWLDARGTGHSEEMRVEERFHRRDYGHMDVTVTVTDPKTFTKPITFSFVEGLLPDTDVLEHVCAEDEKDVAHVNAATGKR